MIGGMHLGIFCVDGDTEKGLHRLPGLEDFRSSESHEDRYQDRPAEWLDWGVEIWCHKAYRD